MNIVLLLLIILLAIVFHAWLVWTFYQIYLAAWHKKGAKDTWVNLLSTPYGQLFYPFFKWGGLVVLIGASINLILIVIYVLFQLVSGGNYAT
jgi:hypothetical protein